MTDYTDEDLRKSDEFWLSLWPEWAKHWKIASPPVHEKYRRAAAAFRAEARREEREANLTLLHEASGLKLSLNDMLERAHEQGRMMERQSEREACERIVEEYKERTQRAIRTGHGIPDQEKAQNAAAESLAVAILVAIRERAK